MNDEKIKIGFDPVDIWDREDFRKLMKALYEEGCYEVSIISNSFDIDYLNTVKSEIGDNITIHMVTNNDSLVTILDDNKIQIYLSGEQKTISFIGAMSTNTYGVLVNNIMDTYRTQPKYISKLKFWINYIQKGESLGKSCE